MLEESKKMTKLQWQNVYNSLSGIYSKFEFESRASQFNRNAKIKRESDIEKRRLIRSAISILNLYPEVGELLKTTLGHSNEYVDEFFELNYFKSDLQKFLLNIEVKIGSLH
jgi:hypothetical protein